MLKKILLAVILALPMFVSAQTIKIGLVNSETILTAMPESATAQQSLANLSKQLEDQMKQLQDEMNRKVEEFKALGEDTPTTIQEQKMKDIQDYQAKLETFYQNAQQELSRKQQELMAPIISKINDAIKSVGQEGNYTIIQETAAVLYFGAPAEDITPLVKAKLGIQ